LPSLRGRDARETAAETAALLGVVAGISMDVN
jgi:hypothetical protein